MAWTSPMTFVANNVLTAAQLNTHLRDNLLELAPAKATTNAGSLFIAQGPNRLEERVVQTARVNTSQTTIKTEWVDLTTPGPAVTVDTGIAAIVMLGCSTSNSVAENTNNMAFAITGDTTRDPQDRYSLQIEGRLAGEACRYGISLYVTDLEPGQNTFTCKYKTSKDTATFAERFIGVIPL